MTISELGALGEFVGSLAVLLTLIYLALQVRHSRELLEENRKISLSQVYQARSGFRVETSLHYMNPEWAKIHAKMRSGGYEQVSADELIRNFESLESWEKLVVLNFNASIVHTMDNTLYQHDLGLLAEDHVSNVIATIQHHHSFWQHIGLMLPPRVQDVYAKSTGT